MAPGGADVSSAALKAFEKALKERELQFASAVGATLALR
jgi:hypothetical protein